MADLYITYGIRERYWVSRLAATLESEGYSVFWDHSAIPGDNVRNESQQALTQAKCALVVWSETAIEDHWVLVDAEQALKQESMISVMASDSEIPQTFQSSKVLDLKDWALEDKQAQQYNKLLHTIKEHCEPSQPSASEKEQQAHERAMRMRAQHERKQQERGLREASLERMRVS